MPRDDKCERSHKDRKDSHKDSKKCEKLEKFEKLDKLKVKDLCVKNLNAVDIQTKTITGVTGTFSNLTVDNATINNLNVTSINGVDPNCSNAPFNFAGVITPVTYVNGVPQKPANPGNFNQAVLDDLWNLNILANASANLDADSGRLRNAILNNFYGCTGCPAINLSGCTGCPIPGYAVFTGSVATGATGATGAILTVSAMLNTSLTNCPPVVGTIQVGQTIFVQNTNSSFLTSTIVSQLTGTGGIGTYLISNKFNDYSQPVSSQTMLSLNNLFPLNECVNVPLRIYGVETLSVGPTGPCNSIISAIAYNLNIANKTLGVRIAAIYVQVGWQVPGVTGVTGVTGSGSTNIQGLVIDTRQFDPSILSFGEQMNNNVLLPTDLITQLSTYNKFSNVVNSVIQLVVYVEDSIEVLIPESGSSTSSSLSLNTRAVTAMAEVTTGPATNFAASFVNAPGCKFPIFTGTAGPYIQPPVGSQVNVTEFFSNNFFSYGTVFFTVGGTYMITNIIEPNSLTLINIISIVPPGNVVSSGKATWQGALTTNTVDFVQPAVGQSIFIFIALPDVCAPLLRSQSVIIADNHTQTIAGVYHADFATPQTESVALVGLTNTGHIVNAPPGTTIPKFSSISILSLVTQ